MLQSLVDAAVSLVQAFEDIPFETSPRAEARDNIPVLQEDIAFLILEHCHGDTPTLRACALVHSRWLSPARSFIFSTLSLESSRVIPNSKALFAALPVIAPHVRRIKLLSYNFKGDRVNPRLRPLAHASVLLTHLAAAAPVLALGVTAIELEDCNIEHDFADLATFFSLVPVPRFVGVRTLELKYSSFDSAKLLRSYAETCPNLEALHLEGFSGHQDGYDGLHALKTLMEPPFEPRIRRLEMIMSVAAHFDLLCEWIARPHCAITTLHTRLNVGHFPRYLIPAELKARALLSTKLQSLTIIAEPRLASFVITQRNDMHTPNLRCLRIIFPKMPPSRFNMAQDGTDEARLVSWMQSHASTRFPLVETPEILCCELDPKDELGGELMNIRAMQTTQSDATDT